MTTAAVLLAGGAGTRFAGSGSKLLAPFAGSTVLGVSVSAAIGAGLDETVVVQGAVDLSAALPAEVTIVENHSWADGLASSLRTATAYADRRDHDAIVVGLADQPLVPPAAWTLVAACRSPICAATFGGRRRPPTRLSQETWASLPTSGDEGARALMRLRPDLVTEVPCPGEPADIDTVEDLRRWS